MASPLVRAPYVVRSTGWILVALMASWTAPSRLPRIRLPLALFTRRTLDILFVRSLVVCLGGVQGNWSSRSPHLDPVHFYAPLGICSHFLGVLVA